MTIRAWWAVGLWGLFLELSPAWAQQALWWTAVWQPLLHHQGLEVTYIFYPEADGVHNGVVLRVHNQRQKPIAYRFEVVFRAADGSEHVEAVSDTLAPGAMRTGDLSGLFWIPFRDGRSLAELGLRKVRVEEVHF